MIHVAREYNVYQYIKFGHQVVKSLWDGGVSEWIVNLKAQDGHKQERLDFVMPATGLFNEWIPLLILLKKRVVVINNGASGV